MMVRGSGRFPMRAAILKAPAKVLFSNSPSPRLPLFREESGACCCAQPTPSETAGACANDPASAPKRRNDATAPLTAVPLPLEATRCLNDAPARLASLEPPRLTLLTNDAGGEQAITAAATPSDDTLRGLFIPSPFTNKALSFNKSSLLSSCSIRNA
ncbi:hypothetical protein NDU88_003099 [Pleurodeles waltl]|uniref:Uncharacterized protein n=1 Tax=Pleurodeles waltl TaxID=8319 RepID=A0AAV7VEH5_PLEWA|nr:hypothetical protein NDU88_003099 [Pleurodeles waltl]